MRPPHSGWFEHVDSRPSCSESYPILNDSLKNIASLSQLLSDGTKAICGAVQSATIEVLIASSLGCARLLSPDTQCLANFPVLFKQRQRLAPLNVMLMHTTHVVPCDSEMSLVGEVVGFRLTQAVHDISLLLGTVRSRFELTAGITNLRVNTRGFCQLMCRDAVLWVIRCHG